MLKINWFYAAGDISDDDIECNTRDACYIDDERSDGHNDGDRSDEQLMTRGQMGTLIIMRGQISTMVVKDLIGK